MSLISLIELIVMIIILPAMIGGLFRVKKDSFLLLLVYGYLVEWASLFVVSVPLIIKGQKLDMLVTIMVVVMAVEAAAGVLIALFRRKKDKSVERKTLSKSGIVYLGIFLALVLFQLYKTVFYAYGDGDDSFYVSTAQIASASNSMYAVDPYIGIAIPINYRYALAPFPMWIAMLSRISGVNVSILAHTILPVILITLTYIIFSSIGKQLFDGNKEKQYMFLCLVAVFEMFSNVSTSTTGTFLLTRARQGKEALANIVVPFVFLYLLKLMKEDRSLTLKDEITLICAGLTASLTSVFGNMLFPLMMLAFLVYSIIKKKGFKTLFLIVVSVIPNILVVLLYLKLS